MRKLSLSDFPLHKPNIGFGCATFKSINTFLRLLTACLLCTKSDCSKQFFLSTILNKRENSSIDMWCLVHFCCLLEGMSPVFLVLSLIDYARQKTSSVTRALCYGTVHVSPPRSQWANRACDLSLLSGAGGPFCCFGCRESDTNPHILSEVATCYCAHNLHKGDWR